MKFRINSNTELLLPNYHSIIRNQGLGLHAHNGYLGEYSFLFFPESCCTHGHQHRPRTTLSVSNIALITTTHIYTHIHMHTHISIIFSIFISTLSISTRPLFFYLSFFSIKDALITPLKPDALLTYQHHKEKPSSTTAHLRRPPGTT